MCLLSFMRRLFSHAAGQVARNGQTTRARLDRNNAQIRSAVPSETQPARFTPHQSKRTRRGRIPMLSFRSNQSLTRSGNSICTISQSGMQSRTTFGRLRLRRRVKCLGGSRSGFGQNVPAPATPAPHPWSHQYITAKS